MTAIRHIINHTGSALLKFSGIRTLLLIPAFLFTLTLSSGDAYAQFSSPGLWVENGVWVGVSPGHSTPLADPMATFHGSGFMMNTSLEFQGAFVNYGVDGGMHIFAETPRYGETIIYPVCAFVTFNLARFYS
ncbi:MAG: hypothetical protein GF372_00315, partial [Candidatus Marinimicrobia bacterium]|nr:hypothetical protein [Candidatus Neomarinimicrobiota bacterium]